MYRALKYQTPESIGLQFYSSSIISREVMSENDLIRTLDAVMTKIEKRSTCLPQGFAEERALEDIKNDLLVEYQRYSHMELHIESREEHTYTSLNLRLEVYSEWEVDRILLWLRDVDIPSTHRDNHTQETIIFFIVDHTSTHTNTWSNFTFTCVQFNYKSSGSLMRNRW